MTSLNVPTARVFKPLLEPSRYKAAYGGRGSGKSHFFAEQIIKDSFRFRGLRSVCIREVQKDLKDSAKKLIEDKLQQMGLGEADGFSILKSEIRTPGDGIISFLGMQDHTAESIKSLEGFKRAWVEEAQTLSARSLALLRPTIRAEGSEIWFSWNPTRRSDPVDALFRGDALPTGSAVVRANWSDNPWFPSVLEQERLDSLNKEPDQYQHIWEGEYATVLAGAYYAQALAIARNEGRIGRVARDPVLPVRCAWDIGLRDATAIWVYQLVGQAINFLDYYEARNQPIGTHLEWLRSRGWRDAECILPHDGENLQHVSAIRFVDHVIAGGFEARTVPNSGQGAYLKRIESARRLFNRMYFNEQTCSPGLDALGWYHEKIDDKRNYGMGEEHDWSSHGAHAFGLACMDYEEPIHQRPAEFAYHGDGAWMS